MTNEYDDNLAEARWADDGGCADPADAEPSDELFADIRNCCGFKGEECEAHCKEEEFCP